VLIPAAGSVADSELVRNTQRRALLSIRNLLLEERAAVTPDALQTRHRSEVVDAILLVLDQELERLEMHQMVTPDPESQIEHEEESMLGTQTSEAAHAH